MYVRAHARQQVEVTVTVSTHQVKKRSPWIEDACMHGDEVLIHACIVMSTWHGVNVPQ